MIRRLRVVWPLLVLLVGSSSLVAQEWARFRGPNGAGQSNLTTIPAAWEADDYLWKVKLPGSGNSSPVLWGDRIFLTSGSADDATRHVLCLSARNGQLLWRRDFPSTVHHLHVQNTFASSTPAVDAKRVYCAWSTLEEITLLALDHDGNEVWRANLGTFTGQHGFGTSPILYRDMVIITNDQDGDSSLIAVDAAHGNVRWQVPRKVLMDQNATYAAPCILKRPGAADQMIVCGRSHGVTSIDPTNGTTNWELPALPRRAVSSPIIVEGLVLATSGNGGGQNTMVAIRPPVSDSDEPKVAYQTDSSTAPYVPTMVANGNLVFLWSDRGIVTCIDAPTGEVHWRQRVGGNYYSSPVRVAQRIYGVSLEGEVVALAASSEYKLLGRSSLGETTRATPAVAVGRMFLRTESHLLAVGEH